jgi:translation initiation factor 2B subunit (eIF-2B alpha/beta/delta family)
MAAVRSAALRAWAAARDGKVARIAGLVQERRHGPLKAAQQMARQLSDGAHVVTLSRSFTVLCVLQEAAGSIRRLTVAESRPACEGRLVARVAARLGLSVELVTDAAACGRVKEADAVVLGADSLTGGGDAVNKVGSVGLCAAAHHFGVRCAIVATLSKVLPQGVDPLMEQGDPAELGEEISGVERTNPTFERVPRPLPGRIVLPTGTATTDTLARTASELRNLQDDLCGEGG